MEDAPPNMGHNQPPLEAHDPEVYEKLSASIERFNLACADWLALKTIETDEQSEKLTDFIAGARKLRSLVESSRKEQKGKWDALGKKVQADYVKLLDRVDAIAKTPNKMQAEWLAGKRLEEERKRFEAMRAAEEERKRAEELRLQAEARNDAVGMADAEAAQKAAEEAEKKAAKAAKVKAGSATGGARSMGLRTVKTAKVLHLAKLFTHYRHREEVEQCLLRLANADLRSPAVDDASIPGIEIITEEKAV